MASTADDEALASRQPIPRAVRLRQGDERRPFSMRVLYMGVAAIAGIAVSGWVGYRLWPRALAFHPIASIPIWERVADRQIVKLPGSFPVAEVGLYDDELFAYLMFQYLRGAVAFKGSEVLLTYRKQSEGRVYPIQVALKNDLIASLALLASAQTMGLIEQYDWRYVNEDTLRGFQYQTQVFVTGYSLRTQHKIEDMSRAELAAYVRRFVRFKSRIDPRVRNKLEPVPHPLSRAEAHRLASDIVAVADFYSLPLDFFLGIGAMENNYMNVKGDLHHAIWKNRAGKGDVILQRGRRGVLVLNPASGVWQITRETLRYVHSLYLKDRRDYTVLPEHLRPCRNLNLDAPRPDVLTTYAGLLFRQLLDQFHGDVLNAVGAYNGGPGNPNFRYGQGVRMVAQYARHIVEQAAALHGHAAADMRSVGITNR
jgi:hypothetical protein